MATIGRVERQVLAVEGFEAHFYRDGRNIRSDHGIEIADYPFKRAARGSWTVREWIDRRWNRYYSGWDVEVRTAQGMPILSRATTLQSVRGR